MCQCEFKQESVYGASGGLMLTTADPLTYHSFTVLSNKSTTVLIISKLRIAYNKSFTALAEDSKEKYL